MQNKHERQKEKKICGEAYQFIVDQIIGMIEIDIESYLFKILGLRLHFNRWSNGGLDIYINDPEYCTVNKFDKLEFNDDDIDDILIVEHLHEEDMLWFIMNYQQEKQVMKDRIDKYIKFKRRNIFK